MIRRKGSPPAPEAERPKGFDDFDLRLGDIMRGERATLGKSLLDVQRELKIKATYIAAIENCDAAAFETPGFIAGYVRSYARFLGLDPEQTFARFCEESGFVTAHGLAPAASGARPRTPAPARRGGGAVLDPLANPNAPFVPKGRSAMAGVAPQAVGSMLVLGALIAGIGYGGWMVLQQIQRVQVAPVDSAPVVMAELDPLAAALRVTDPATAPAVPGAALDLDPLAGAGGGDAAPRDDALAQLYRTRPLDAPVFVPRDGPIAAIDPAEATAADAGDAMALAIAREVEIETPVQVIEPPKPGVELFAVRPAWVRVRAADGTVLLEKTLDAGERWTVPPSDVPPTLHAGNSGAVYFGINGETYGPAAAGAQVVRNVALSVDALSERYQVADLDGDPELARLVAEATQIAPAAE